MAELVVGIKAIDEEHVLLLGQVDAIVEQARAPGPADRLLPAVDELLSSLQAHFGTERALMHRYAYPAREAHESAHQAFLAAVEGLKANLTAAYKVPVDRKIELLIGDWLQSHIEGHDRDLARFLKERGEP